MKKFQIAISNQSSTAFSDGETIYNLRSIISFLLSRLLNSEWERDATRRKKLIKGTELQSKGKRGQNKTKMVKMELTQYCLIREKGEKNS